jgi:hypothetical protein
MYVPRVSIETRSPWPLLPASSVGTRFDTACHDPTSLQSKPARTTATPAAFSITA